MEASPKQIVYYLSPDGKVPFKVWFTKIQDIRLKQAVTQRLNRMADGNYGDCESVGDRILELRFKAFGVRIYFAEIEGVIVLLLCAGNKSSQVKDIAKAKGYWAEYCSRIEGV